MRLMSALSRHVFHPLWDLKDGSQRLGVLRTLQRTQWLPLGELLQLQRARLEQIVRYAAANSPYYQQLFRERGFDPAKFDLAAFSSLPLLTKSIIRASTDTLLSQAFRRDELGHHKTGGSTGVALTTYFDRDWLEIRTADALRSDQWAGAFHGMKVAALWGNPPVARTLKERLRRACIDRFVYLDTIDLNERSIEAFIAAWRRERPEVLFGHSHSLYMLAHYLLEKRISDLRPQGIVSTSMMLLAHERREIEQAFNCKVTDRYGSEEVGLIACECERHAGMHLNIEHLYIEFLRSDGSPATGGGGGRHRHYGSSQSGHAAHSLSHRGCRRTERAALSLRTRPATYGAGRRAGGGLPQATRRLAGCGSFTGGAHAHGDPGD